MSLQMPLFRQKRLQMRWKLNPNFEKKRVIHRKKQFGESVDCGEKLTPEESFRIEYFFFIVDQVISSLTNRFE